jgi:diguanylate cyclase (GGDEF)-like protein
MIIRDKTVITDVKRPEIKEIKQAYLVIIYGKELGRRFKIDIGVRIIGRAIKSDIYLDDDSVSRTHAKIKNNGKSIQIQDLKSTNGTYVNDQSIILKSLHDGDLIKIGRTIFKFLAGNNLENAYHEEIYRLMTTDGLTQVFNKRYLLEVLEREISRSKRYGGYLSLILFDIDHFKDINDSYGHLAGDYVLQYMCRVIKSKIRRSDIFGRYGGEEFLIILPEIPRKGAYLLAEKIRRLIQETDFVFDQLKIPVTISLGITELTSEMIKVEDMITKADENLYLAKQKGRNRTAG